MFSSYWKFFFFDVMLFILKFIKHSIKVKVLCYFDKLKLFQCLSVAILFIYKSFNYFECLFLFD